MSEHLTKWQAVKKVANFLQPEIVFAGKNRKCQVCQVPLCPKTFNFPFRFIPDKKFHLHSIKKDQIGRARQRPCGHLERAFDTACRQMLPRRTPKIP
jgi:hypothetical protein